MQNPTLNQTEEHDQEDLITLVKVLLKQAIDDYIKLRHPAWRRKKELKDALISSTEFLFDDTYTSKAFKTDEDEPASLKYLLNIITYVNKERLEEIRQNIINEAINFWTTIELTTIAIPDAIVFKGYTWLVVDRDISEPIIDFENRLLILDTKPTEKNQKQFLNACVSIIALENKTVATPEFTDGLWEMLRMNNCFSGHS